MPQAPDEPWLRRHWRGVASSIEDEYRDEETPSNALRWQTLMNLRNALVRDHYAAVEHVKEFDR